MCVLVAQLYPNLCDPMDYSQPDSSAHGIFQPRILEWVSIPFSRGSSPPKIKSGSPSLQWILYHLNHQFKDVPSNLDSEEWTLIFLLLPTWKECLVNNLLCIHLVHPKQWGRRVLLTSVLSPFANKYWSLALTGRPFLPLQTDNDISLSTLY